MVWDSVHRHLDVQAFDQTPRPCGGSYRRNHFYNFDRLVGHTRVGSSNDVQWVLHGLARACAMLSAAGCSVPGAVERDWNVCCGPLCALLHEIVCARGKATYNADGRFTHVEKVSNMFKDDLEGFLSWKLRSRQHLSVEVKQAMTSIASARPRH